jgi:hypothetical protein
MACELFAGVNIHVFLPFLVDVYVYVHAFPKPSFYIETGKRELNLKIIFPLDLNKLISLDWPVLQYSRNRILKKQPGGIGPFVSILGLLKILKTPAQVCLQ